MCLCDHGNFTHIKQKLFSIFKSKFFINSSNNFSSPSIKRKLNLSCRIGLNYQRETVQFQREKISKLLKKYVETTKISRFKYLNEIKNSKYVVSPFGWGEICPRDFEIFMNGGILIKPDMKTIDTWPNWYISEKTYLPFNWDLKDFNKKIEFALNNLGKIFYEMRKYNKSLNYYLMALELNNNNEILHNNLGLLYERKNRFKKSQLHFKQALKIKPIWIRGKCSR